MDMVCLEPCKIQKRQTISWANCKIGLILNIWHMGKFSIHSLEGLPFTISALWPELGMGAALRGGIVGTSLAPAGSYSALWFLAVIFSEQGPNFLHTLLWGAQMLTFISWIPWVKQLPELSSLWGQPFLATAPIFSPLRSWFCNTEHRHCNGLDVDALFKQGGGIQTFFGFNLLPFQKGAKSKTWGILDLVFPAWFLCVLMFFKEMKTKNGPDMGFILFIFNLCRIQRNGSFICHFWENILSSFCSAHRVVERDL